MYIYQCHRLPKVLSESILNDDGKKVVFNLKNEEVEFETSMTFI